jgi:hypothetical protein
MEYGDPHVDVRKPLLLPASIEGAPAKALQRHASVHGEWHLWIYCCQWSLLLEDIQLAHNESDDVTMARALGLLNGQVLQAVDIEPDDGRTKFTFDLGCSLLTCPSQPGIYDEPGEQWKLFSGFDPDLVVLIVRGDGSYSIGDGHEKPEDKRWQPIATPVRVHE